MVPTSLYDVSTSVMHLPPRLVKAYRYLIGRHSLADIRSARTAESSQFGGASQELTDAHFAQAFDGSCARAQLALINPLRAYTRVANAFLEALSGNAVCIVDAPCGAGAASLTFLTCIAELREKGVLPRQPLEVRLVGAELSEAARNYADELLNEVRPFLDSQAIVVKYRLMHWDVLDAVATRNVIEEAILQSGNGPCKRLLLVANFSGFLKHGTNRSDAAPQLDNLFLYMSGSGNVALWIEPGSNAARRLLEWLIDRAKRWTKFAAVKQPTGPWPAFQAKSHYQRPLPGEGLSTAHLAVLRVDLEP